MKKCKVCDVDLPPTKKGAGKQRKFCSKKCLDHDFYTRHKERYILYARKWAKANPIKKKMYVQKALAKFLKNKRPRFNELMRRGYQRNKIKWHSRTKTLKVLEGGGHLLKKQCRICKTKDNIQIHHEIYLRKTKEIIKAIEENKIYYLCKKHHNHNR